MRARCCVVGGGPAGVMLGYLLARSGVEVVVLEKHGDFLRDFRGDTVHASTLEALYELGILDGFLARPHTEYRRFRLNVEGRQFDVARFDKLPTHCKFIALMPQWDFLDFLTGEAAKYPSFRLLINTEATRLILEDGKVVGVLAKGPEGEIKIDADLVVACDGRHSAMRQEAELALEDFGVPVDVLWMKIPKTPDMPTDVLAYVAGGSFLILIDRADYFQAGILIVKGAFDKIRSDGLPKFRESIVALAPFLTPAIDDLTDWDQVRLLTVRIDRLKQWAREGLLCIGDAAHAMSPAGGIGINLAIQDAIATANILAEPLREGPVSLDVLRKVQERRAWPTRFLQSLQVFIHRQFLRPANPDERAGRMLRFAWAIRTFPILSSLLARIIGMGPRMEHVRTHETAAP